MRKAIGVLIVLALSLLVGWWLVLTATSVSG
jgi:hypothetical protein